MECRLEMAVSLINRVIRKIVVNSFFVFGVLKWVSGSEFAVVRTKEICRSFAQNSIHI